MHHRECITRKLLQAKPTQHTKDGSIIFADRDVYKMFQPLHLHHFLDSGRFAWRVQDQEKTLMKRGFQVYSYL